MKKILFVLGSLRTESLNRQLANHIMNDLKDRYLCEFLDYSNVPWMNQDIEFPVPETVSKLRKQVKSCDGLWFVTPEYNSSYPGFIKNLIDWLSRPTAAGAPRDSNVLWKKKCTVSCVGGGAKGAGCIAAMQRLLPFVGAHAFEEPLGIGYDRQELESSVLSFPPERLARIMAQEDGFCNFLESDQE